MRKLTLNVFFILLSTAIVIGIKAKANDSPVTVDEQYTGQTNVSCKETDYKIPSYLAFSMNKGDYLEIYLNNGMAYCENKSLEIEWGLMKDCNGANVCNYGGFSLSKASPSLLESTRESISQYESVTINKNITGYYIPSECFAYCTQAKLVWIIDDIVYQIKTIQFLTPEVTKDELVKSALSYINDVR